jgi:hypothetical protein
MSHVEIFTPDGVVSGSTVRSAVGAEPKGTSLHVDTSRWYPLDGSAPQRRGSVTVTTDEQLVVVLSAPPFTVHASWYPIALDVGPYHVEGRLPTAPGFDPARALARPSGPFVALRDVTISLIGRTGAGAAERAFAQVNRYAVERVASTLMLSFFFPGATSEPLTDHGGGAVPPLVGKPAPA